MEPNVIFEDDQILVLDKPSGMTVNRADTTKNEVTLQDWVEGYLKLTKVSKGERKEGIYDTYDPLDAFLSRAGIVHRLDKETSGIILIAKTLPAFENLQKQFKERTVKKIYTALVHGKVEPDQGEVRASVGRLPWDRKKFGVIAGGREAITKYKVIFNYQFCNAESIFKEHLTLLEIYPETGRTHQIRIHLKYINHPIFSDPLYAGRKTARDDRKILPRVFLHAAKILFSHPQTNQQLSLESPLSKELQEFLQTLEKV